MPAWDGNPRTFNKYKTMVEWCVSGTRLADRRYIVGRLLPKLTGPAGILVSKWRAKDFENDNGAGTFLDRLGRTPLVRRALPDANAAMDRFLGDLARRPGETVSQ